MAKENLHLRVITVDRQLLDLDVDSVTLPTAAGQITILKDHQPLISKLETGELIYRTAGQEHSLLVSAGFADKRPNNDLVIIVDNAYLARELSVSKAEAAMRQAQENLKIAKDKKELLMAEASLKQAFWEAKIAKKNQG